MLRVARNEDKGNAAKLGGCRCIANKSKIPQNIQLMQPKLLSSTLKPGVFSINGPRNGQMTCGCIRGRSKSSNENFEKENLVPNATYNKRRSSVSTTADINTLDPNSYSYTQRNVTRGLSERRKEDISYDHILKKEIRGILDDKHQAPKSTDLSKSNIKKPAIIVSYSKSSVDKNTQKYQVFSSTMVSVVPETQIKRHSHSSTINNEKGHIPISYQGRQSLCQIEPRISNAQNIPKKTNNSNVIKIHEDRIEKSQCNYKQKKVHYEQEIKRKTAEYSKTYIEIPQHSNATGGSKTLKDGISPIPPNHFTSKHTLITKNFEALREPKIKKRVKKNPCQILSAAFVGDIYNEEYLHDIIKYIKKQEPEITLKDKFLEKFNADCKCRAKIVNWILRQQANLNFSESEYYLAVNLFDHVLASLHVPINMYQLIILTSLWIAMKLIGSNSFKASSFIKLCEGAYLSQQILKMEQKVLKIMNCKIHTTEPTVCVSYYLKFFGLQEICLAKLSVHYILDCFSLTPEFSSTPVSILAAASVKYTLTKYHDGNQHELNNIFGKLLSQAEIDKIRSVEALIYLQLINMADENYTLKEPYYKYGKKKTDLNMKSP